MAKTPSDIRLEMAAHIDRMVTYWSELPDLSVRDRCDGVAFSVLTMLDGAASLPRFLLIQHAPGDPEYPDGLLVNGDTELHASYAEYCRSKPDL